MSIDLLCKSTDLFPYGWNISLEFVNPFLANVPILHPLKTQEKLWFSSVFRGYRMRTLAKNLLINVTV